MCGTVCIVIIIVSAHFGGQNNTIIWCNYILVDKAIIRMSLFLLSSQFAFIVLFTTFILTCLQYELLFRDKILVDNGTVSRDIVLSDLFDVSRLRQ